MHAPIGDTSFSQGQKYYDIGRKFNLYITHRSVAFGYGFLDVSLVGSFLNDVSFFPIVLPKAEFVSWKMGIKQKSFLGVCLSQLLFLIRL